MKYQFIQIYQESLITLNIYGMVIAGKTLLIVNLVHKFKSIFKKGNVISIYQ